MTDKIMEVRRAAFHASKVASALNLNIDEITGQYRAYGTECSWRAWNEALDSLCVTLPESCKQSTEDLDEGYNAGFLKLEMIEAIHAAGVKTK